MKIKSKKIIKSGAFSMVGRGRKAIIFFYLALETRIGISLKSRTVASVRGSGASTLILTYWTIIFMERSKKSKLIPNSKTHQT